MKARNALIAVITVIIIYYFISSLVNKKKTSSGSKVDVDSNYLDSSVSYDSIAQQMRNALFGILQTSSEKSRALDAWMERNDEEFKHLSNIYNQNFAEAPETVRTHIEGEFVINYFKKNDFLDRMDRLNLA